MARSSNPTTYHGSVRSSKRSHPFKHDCVRGIVAYTGHDDEAEENTWRAVKMGSKYATILLLRAKACRGVGDLDAKDLGTGIQIRSADVNDKKRTHRSRITARLRLLTLCAISAA